MKHHWNPIYKKQKQINPKNQNFTMTPTVSHPTNPPPDQPNTLYHHREPPHKPTKKHPATHLDHHEPNPLHKTHNQAQNQPNRPTGNT